MERFFSVVVRYPNGDVKTFKHVPSKSLNFSSNTNYCHFIDADGKHHYIMGSTVIADEEVPESNINVLLGDVIS